MFRPSADMFKTKFTNSTRDRSVTLMLLAIVALFLLCNGLAFCNSIVESIMLIRASAVDEAPAVVAPTTTTLAASLIMTTTSATLEMETTTTTLDDDGDDNDYMKSLVKMFEISVEIANVLITLNSATSALVYLIFSSKYRLVLKSILGFRKRKKINRVAVTTALAAQRAVELSLIPEEADNRKRQLKEQQQQLLSFPMRNTNNNAATSNERTPRLFRAQTVATSGGGNTLPHSESHLRLMDDEDNFIFVEEKFDVSS